MKVLNMGSLNLDYVYSVPHMVREGETLAADRMEVYCGGKGLNQSIALARAGVQVFHAGLIGEDGEILLKLCRENGIDTRYIKRVPGKSGHTIIQVDRNAQNCILLFGGSNRAFSRDYVEEVLKDFGAGDVLLLQNEINLLEEIVELADKKEMKIILNPSPMDDGLKKVDLSKISLFLINEIEGTQLTGEEEVEKMLAIFRRKYPDAEIVLTLGEKGAVYQNRERRIIQKAYPAKAVDTTGAGDTFTGYFIAGLLKNTEISERMAICARASAVAVSRKGAAASIPSAEEVGFR